MCWPGEPCSAATCTLREMYPGGDNTCSFRRRWRSTAPDNWRQRAKCQSSGEAPNDNDDCPRGRNGFSWFSHNSVPWKNNNCNRIHSNSRRWHRGSRRPFVADGCPKSVDDDKCREKVQEFCTFGEFPTLDANHIQGFGEAVPIPWVLRPSAVGLCCRMHRYPNLATPKEHFKAEMGKFGDSVQSYASALKRPGGEAPKAEKALPPKNGCRSLTSLFKSCPPEAASDERADVVRPQRAKPVRFNELKELVGRTETGGASNAVPIPKTNLAALARRNSDMDKITCLVGEIRIGKISPQLSPTNGNKNLSPRLGCGNALIAFIMGSGFSPPDLGAGDDESDWDEEEEAALQSGEDEPDAKSEPKRTIPKDAPQSLPCNGGRFQQQLSDERLAEINRKWRLAYDAVLMRHSSSKVSFANDEKLCVVHNVESEERKGPWEEFARDRCRFRKKVQEVSLVIDPILDSEHRAKVFKKLYGTSQDEDRSTGDDCDKNYKNN